MRNGQVSIDANYFNCGKNYVNECGFDLVCEMKRNLISLYVRLKLI